MKIGRKSTCYQVTRIVGKIARKKAPTGGGISEGKKQG
jgi:hypothetical protein